MSLVLDRLRPKIVQPLWPVPEKKLQEARLLVGLQPSSPVGHHAADLQSKEQQSKKKSGNVVGWSCVMLGSLEHDVFVVV
jgi:hypothetical protein